ncbi:uncharacterized protein atf7ip2 isoform 2-T2 [Polymixia lowei]
MKKKRRRSPSPPVNKDEVKMKFSRFEVQRMIKEEVQSAVKQTETKLECLLEKVQQLEHEANYDSAVRKIEAHIKKVKRRGDAAIAYVRKLGMNGTQDNSQIKSPMLSPAVTAKLEIPGSSSEDEPQQTVSHSKRGRNRRKDNGELFQTMETTKKALKKMDADNEALKAAIADLDSDLPPTLSPFSPQRTETTKKAQKNMDADNEALKAAIIDLCNELPPPALSPISPRRTPVRSVKEKVRPAKEDKQKKVDGVKAKSPSDDNNGSPQHAGSEKTTKEKSSASYQEEEEEEEQGADRFKVECLSSDNSSPQHTDSEKDVLLYPPLPATPFPSTLNMEAASYNIPQKLMLQLALIRNPPGLSVLWNSEEEDPSGPPMDSYSVFMAVETSKGSGFFPEWKTLGEVKAIPLPMCVMISKYKPGFKACFAVVGKDTFGRYGPYSEVVPATIPD